MSYPVVLGPLPGLLILLLGALKLGFLYRFVSNAVMTVFFSGLCILTIISQVEYLTGSASDAEEKVFQTIDTIIHWQQIDWDTFFVGSLTKVLIAVLDRTSLSSYSFADDPSQQRLFDDLLKTASENRKQGSNPYREQNVQP